jgi:hypothetical protein
MSKSTKKDLPAEEIAVELTVGQQMASTLRKHRVGYAVTKSYSGKPSLDNGGDLAVFLRGKTPQEVMELAERVLQGVNTGDLAKKYGKLNAGQKRMNAGNLLRNAMKRGEIKMKDLD